MDDTPKKYPALRKQRKRWIFKRPINDRPLPSLIPNPLRLNETGAGIVQLLLLSVALTRGLDYIGDENTPGITAIPILSVLERSIPGGLLTWGIVFIASAVLVGFGLFSGKLMVESVGHGLIGAAYLGIGVGQMTVVVEISAVNNWRPGTGTLVSVVCVLIASAAVWLRANATRGWTKLALISKARWLWFGLPRGTGLGILTFGILTITLSADGIRTSIGLVAAGGLHLVYCMAAARLADLDIELGLPVSDEESFKIGG